MSSTYTEQVRCCRCDFLITAGEARLRCDQGWLHPTCLYDGEVVDE